MQTKNSFYDNKHPFHVAIIMDGNGRWAQHRGKPRFFGHRSGAETVRRIVESAPSLGITTLTLYAFSSDNWKRPATEVSMLMRLFRTYLQSEVENLRKNGARLSFIGRRDRFDPAIIAGMEKAEQRTKEGDRLHLRLAVDYSARDSIISAARKISDKKQDISREEFSQLLNETIHGNSDEPDVDLLIRTGGEKRLSDYLLWECAYAELSFTSMMWPEFQPADLESAVLDFRHRDRRFGCVPQAMAV